MIQDISQQGLMSALRLLTILATSCFPTSCFPSFLGPVRYKLLPNQQLTRAYRFLLRRNLWYAISMCHKSPEYLPSKVFVLFTKCSIPTEVQALCCTGSDTYFDHWKVVFFLYVFRSQQVFLASIARTLPSLMNTNC